MKRACITNLMILLAFAAGSVYGQQLTKQLQRINTPDGIETYAAQAVYFDISPPLRDMMQDKDFSKAGEAMEVENHFNSKYETYGRHPFLLPEDPVWQKQDGTYQPLSPIQNWEGINNLSGVYPPDTQGDVGPSNYFQVVNLKYAIYNKTGGLLVGPSNLSTIWAGIPSPWNGTNNGDPVVLYDQDAQRWVVSQFSLPNTTQYAELIAVSQTSDPTGSWYRYVFQFNNQMPDYPKLGVWPDGYYLSFNKFQGGSTYSGVGACALQRSKMLTGDQTAAMVYKSLTSSQDPWAMLPSDWDGSTTPPSGAPNYFTYYNDWSYSYQTLNIWSFSVDWNTPANSTFAQTFSLTTSAFNSVICSDPNMLCINQPGTSQKLMDLGDRLMYRLQYRNFGSYQTMVTCHSVNADGNGHAGVRWYELRNSGSGWTIYQQGTYAPSTTHRWMGSVAMNGNGDIALGYTISDNSSNYPSIRYTGRRATDALGTMTVTEQSIINGSGNQTGSYGRWGDYSMMSVDPSDDQTFWYTTEYIQSSGVANWQTRIASFKFSNAPTVTTTAATNVASTTATLNGTINPNGLSSTYHFEYGTTVSYGTSTSNQSAGSGTSNVNVSANITGLNPSTLYHFRLVGTNSDGTTNGNDMTFTTTAGSPTLNVVPANQNVPYTPAGSTTFTVTSNSSWTVVSDASWCTVTPSGTGNGTITANYTENITTSQRIAHITVTVAGISPVVVTVTQAPAPPTLAVVPSNQNVPSSPAGTTDFTVTSNTTWTVTSDASWCTVTPSGSGNGTITATYDVNPDVNVRIAHITVTVSGLSPIVVTVTQAAAAPYLTVVPPNQNVPAAPPGYTLFSVSCNTIWTVTSDASWCAVTPPNGQWDGTITATYTENTSTSGRVANITVIVSNLSPVVVTVTQSGVAPTLNVSPANQNVPYTAGQTSFNVISNSAWTAASDSAWLTVTGSGYGNGTILADYMQNPYYTSRVGTITVTVAGLTPQTVTVTQAQSTVSVIEHSADAIRLIPNPSKGTFRIETGDLKFGSLKVSVMDISGRKILFRECREKADLRFDLSVYPEGCYFIKILVDNEEQVQKLILTH